MRETSAAYRTMMQGRELNSRIEVVITSPSGSTVTLENEDVIKDSVAVNWRASNNRELSLGTCYSTSLNFTALKSPAAEQAVAGASSLVIEPTLYYDTGNGTEQAFALGRFICDEPQAFIKTTTYECNDEMLAFDLRVTSRFSGTPYNVANFICNTCGVPLGNTAQAIAAMCNGEQIVVIDPKEVSTYRDALAYIGIMLGCFCIIGYDGKFYFRRYHKTSDLSIGRGRRTETVFAGYKTQFAGIKCRFLASQNYYPYQYTIEGRDGIILDVGDIPIIEDTERVKKAILKAIFDDVLADCIYYPCTVTMVGDPSIEVGDMVMTQDRDGTWRPVIVTSSDFSWRQTAQIVSEGGNPKQGRVSTAAKRAAQRAEQQAANNEIVTATFVNAGGITLDSEEEKEITNLRFVTNKELTAIFGAEIPVYATGDGYVEITYTDSGIDGDVVTAQVHAGYNLITLVNHMHFDANRVVLLQLKAQAAALGGGTAPTVTIDADKIRSYIFAQGISIEAPWDGIITIAEDIGLVTATMALYGLTDGCTVSVLVPVASAVIEPIAAVVAALQTCALNDTLNVSIEYGDQILRMGMGHRAGMGRMLAPLSV